MDTDAPRSRDRGSVISLCRYLTNAGGRLRTTFSPEEALPPTAAPARGAIVPTAVSQLERPAGVTARVRERIRNRTLSAR